MMLFGWLLHQVLFEQVLLGTSLGKKDLRSRQNNRFLPLMTLVCYVGMQVKLGTISSSPVPTLLIFGKRFLLCWKSH
ncbi:hypothetical protein SLEP1_g48564 [Rubroshorea leprosula]|uniref:Uncharacterized protein n=1 Tax=Rubroshorea leprosula TaxID=152421 RepID=A0AAV5LUW4_9ROSI|nr:hypothetical protein SLEP1_g48564 [Rubroshorea leprosula]